jgi:tetrahydromethanopterin S-methyltransferase subunit B
MGTPDYSGREEAIMAQGALVGFVAGFFLGAALVAMIVWAV